MNIITTTTDNSNVKFKAELKIYDNGVEFGRDYAIVSSIGELISLLNIHVIECKARDALVTSFNEAVTKGYSSLTFPTQRKGIRATINLYKRSD